MNGLLDNTVLSNFARVGSEEQLAQALGGAASTTEQVLEEFTAGVRLGLLPPVAWSWLPTLQLRSSESVLYAELRQELGAGEASCLAIAVHRKRRVFTDDRRCRRLAGRRGVGVSGTLGILVWMVNSAILSHNEADRQLQAMIESGYHSPFNSLRDVDIR